MSRIAPSSRLAQQQNGGGLMCSNFIHKALASVIILLSVLSKNSNAQVLRCGHDLPALVAELYGSDELNFPEKHGEEHPTGRLGIRSGHVIPVVIHIVRHPDDPYISDAAIRAQMEQLNTDFSGRNDDRSRIPEAFSSVSSTSIIQFCLAEKDPKGKPSSGVVRVETDVYEIGRQEALFFSNMGGSDAWDTRQYLNIWVANIGGLAAGFGSYPGLVPEDKDGIVVNARFFGPNNSPSFNRGRVAVHEVGHYLGLRHTWDMSGSCEERDSIEDTPLQYSYYLACPEYPQFSCGSSDMFMNFMDYVDDDCMVMFTEGQMLRMIWTLEHQRSELLQNSVCAPTAVRPTDSFEFTVSPNPSTGDFFVQFPGNNLYGKLEIVNSTGQIIYAQEGLLYSGMLIHTPINVNGIFWVRILGNAQKLVISN